MTPGSSTESRPSTPKFHVPADLLGPEVAAMPSTHKIHILGDDERAKFIAHALSGVYDAVELLSRRPHPPHKYSQIQRPRFNDKQTEYVVESNQALRVLNKKGDKALIDQLVVSGQGVQAAEALESVKDRVDQQTTVCLMNDGLGVLDDVRKRIFNTPDSAPRFVLGHMSHTLAFNRKSNSVKLLKNGYTKLTLGYPRFDDDKNPTITSEEDGVNFVSAWKGAKGLRTSLEPYDAWLRFKLPSVIFDAVVEPVCVMLEMPYQGILQNSAARRLMHSLLDEIVAVVDNMPEVRESLIVKEYIRGKSIHRMLQKKIMGKRDTPSQLNRRIDRGLPTDVEYLNGYFIRRGDKLGVDLRTNIMVRDMIKAKHSQAIEKLNSYVPVEETSVPSHMAFRYRTVPK
ncbi:hypothetical protein HIM_04856 [Hirsutella minnesotensis 3608]|uniref:2-dehydropantoate 2-reductase n=1 Tax=Hirsutella minnesotensis 3608 TaxID=1043627 RepID=A0A0F8A5P7_9HYPO|nr:hypothetical protein HIM_04856 [Hirsutella minnesotensis 3608]